MYTTKDGTPKKSITLELKKTRILTDRLLFVADSILKDNKIYQQP